MTTKKEIKWLLVQNRIRLKDNPEYERIIDLINDYSAKHLPSHDQAKFVGYLLKIERLQYSGLVEELNSL